MSVSAAHGPATTGESVGAGSERSADLVVVGAGIAGLTLAYTVVQRCPRARVVVLEAGDRPGGQVITEVAEGYTFEHGASAMMSPGDEVASLIDRLGLADRMETASAAGHSTAVWVNGRLNPLPSGLASAARTGLLSTAAKARLIGEPLLGRGRPAPDETVYEFARRRFGEQTARVLMGALVQGVTAGDPREIGFEAFSPRMWRLDQAAGGRSLLLTVLGQRRAARQAARRRGDGEPAAGAPRPARSRPVTLRDGGLGVIVDALAARIGNRLQYRAAVRSIEPSAAHGSDAAREPGAVGEPGAGRRPGTAREAGTPRRFVVVDDAGRRIETDTVVLAIPAYAAARLLQAASPRLAAVLDTIDYTDLRVVGLGYPRTAFAHVPQGFGFLSPPGEGLDIIGATISSNAFEEQAPPGRILLRAFVGGVFAPGLVDLPSEAAVDVVRRNLRRVFGVRGEPEFVRDVVWRRAIPQYQRHHLALMGRIQAMLGDLPGMHLAGNSYRGVGLEDTIRDAERLGRCLADTDLVRASTEGDR